MIKKISNPEEILSVCRKDPQFVMEYILGLTGKRKLHPYQMDIVSEVWDKGREGFKRIAWSAANNVGKDYTSAAIGLGFLYTFRPSKIIITSKTNRQAKEQFWAEYKSHYLDSRFFNDLTNLNESFGTLLETKHNIAAGWYSLCFTVREGASLGQVEAAFEGYHSPNMLLIIHEAKHVVKGVWTAAERLFRQRHGGVWRVLAASTPPITTRGSEFVKCFKGTKKALWTQKFTSAYESPLVDKEAIEESIKEFGKDSPMVRSMIDAKMPNESAGGDFLFTEDLIDMCMRESDIDEIPSSENGKIAIDWARLGDNETVFGTRTGNYVHQFKTWMKKKGPWSVGEAFRLIQQFPTYDIISDEIGLGGPIQDFVELIQEEHGVKLKIKGIKVSDRAHHKPDYYCNVRAEMYWELSKRIEEGSISLPYDLELKDQLLNIKKDFDSKGRMKIQSKANARADKDVKAAFDRADTLAMLFYELQDKDDIEVKLHFV